MAPPPVLYAEHLQHIRQTTITITLSSANDASTQVCLSLDGETLSVSHRGESSHLKLPRRLPPSTTTRQLALPSTQTHSGELCLRISVEDGGAVAEREGTGGGVDDGAVPWSPEALGGAQIACEACGGLVTERGRVSEWRRMPTRNWEELMELWHCHKPSCGGRRAGHRDEDEDAKDYSAANRLVAQPGVGLVDSCHLLLYPEDCLGVAVSFTALLFLIHTQSGNFVSSGPFAFSLSPLAVSPGIAPAPVYSTGSKKVSRSSLAPLIARPPIQLP